MHRALLIALLVLAASCGSDRMGAYFQVEGGDIAFDRVEFFFGKVGPLADAVVITPALAEMAPPGPGLLLRRNRVESDVTVSPAAVSSLTYYVPSGEPGANLGDYVAVIAYRGETPVGIAEYFDFVVPSDLIHIYELSLLDITREDVERWGRPQVDCLRWSREREGGRPRHVTVARRADADCDTFVDRDDPAADCDPLQFCSDVAGVGCKGSVPCVSDVNGCMLGTCVNVEGAAASCAPEACLLSTVCSNCDLTAPAPEVIECALLADLFPGTHVDTPMRVQGNLSLCSEPHRLILYLPTACTNPRIEAVLDYMTGPAFSFTVALAPNNACVFTVTPEIPGSAFSAVPHLLVTYELPSGDRASFELALIAEVGACPGGEQVITLDDAFLACGG